MAVITVQEIPRNNGIQDVTMSVASTADEFDNDGRTLYLVNNASGATRTITFQGIADAKYGREGDVAKTLADGAWGLYGPFDQDGFNASDGNVDVTLDTATSVTVAALRFKDPTGP